MLFVPMNFPMVYTIFPVSYDHNQEAWEIVFISHNYVFRLKTTHYVAIERKT